MRISRDSTPYFALFLLLSFCPARAQDSTAVKTPDYPSQVRAVASLNQQKVAQNHAVRLTVEVSWRGDLDRFEIQKCSAPALTNLDVAGSASSNWVGENDGALQTVKTFEFVLQPQSLGMAYVDGVTIEYRDAATDQVHSLVTGRLDLTVTDPVYERDNRPLAFIGVGVLVVALCVAGFSFYLKRKREKQAAAQARMEATISLEQRFLNELRSRIKLGDSNIDESFAELAKLLRRYLSEKYGIAAMGMAPAEIRNELSHCGVDQNVIQQTVEVLEASDVAKFSGGRTERSGVDRAYVLVEQIIERHQNGETSHSAIAEKNNE